MQAIEQYISAILKTDEEIKQILEKTNLLRMISNNDREFYRTWTNRWNFSLNQILEVASLADGKINPMSYLNKILADIFAKGISSDADIKKYIKSTEKQSTKTTKQTKENFVERTYTQEELSAVFDSLDDIEI